MKINKTIALGAGVCALALTAVATPVSAADKTNNAQAPAAQTTEAYQPKKQDVYIDYNPNFGIAVWNTPNGHTTGKFVPGHSTVTVSGYQVINGHTWYLLADNSGWVDSTFAKAKTTSTTTTAKNDTTSTKTTPAKQETSKAKDDKVGYNIKIDDTVRVINSKGAVIYSAPNTTKKTNRVLPKNSNWKAFIAEDNGYLWYNLGGNQWVNAMDVAPNSTKTTETVANAKNNKNNTKPATETKKDQTQTPKADPNHGYDIPAFGTVTVSSKKGAPVYSNVISTAKTSRTLPFGSNWKTFRQLNNGFLWYNLGGNQWVSEFDVEPVERLSYPTVDKVNKADSNTTSQPKNVTGTLRINYVPGYGIAVWTQPAGKNYVKGKKLKHNTNWKFFKTVQINGRTWYNLGGNQWIDGKYAVVK